MSVEGLDMGGSAYVGLLIEAHCACGTMSRDILFNGTSMAMDLTGATFCYGDATCRALVVDLVQALVGSDSLGGTGAWGDRSELYSELVRPCVPEDNTYYSEQDEAFDWSCLETCPGDVLAVVGDQDAFCALDLASKSCLHNCMSQEVFDLHCECETGLLFSSSETSDGSLTADKGIISQIPKELEFNRTLFCYGSDLNASRPLPSASEACRTAVVDVVVLADTNINARDNALTWDDHYAELDSNCNCLMTCSDDVQATVSDENAFCALADEDLACMLNSEQSPLLRAVHCSCNSGRLFSEKEWGDFDALGQAYCCADSPTLFGVGGGGNECRAAVLALALSLDESNLGSEEMAQLLASQCDDVDDDSGDLRYLCTTASPTPSPTLTLAPTSIPCTATCTDELQETLGDFDAFCSLGNATAYNFSYCLSDAVASDLQLEVHCACQSRALFLSTTDDYELLGGEPYCCGSDTCQAAILDLAVELDIAEYGDPRDTRVNDVNPDLVNLTLVAKAVLREWRIEDAYIAGLFETAAYVAQLNYSNLNCSAAEAKAAAEVKASNGTNAEIRAAIEAQNCSHRNASQVYRFSTDYGEYAYLENVTYEYTYADYWGLADRLHSASDAYARAEELVAEIYAGAVSDHRATIQAGLESSCRDTDTGISVFECNSPFPTQLPTAAPSTADTATVSISVSMVANEPPTSKEKSTVKSVIAAQAGVSLSAIKNFKITTVEDRRRRNLLTVIWAVTFDVSSPLSSTANGDLSSSAEVGSMVTSVLMSDDFVKAVSKADQTLELSVDSNSITAIASTRNPSQSPTHLPTVLPTISLPPTPLPTHCEDVGGFCEYVSSYCSVSFCRTCPNAGICDETCDVCMIRIPTVEPSISFQPSTVPMPPPSQLPTFMPVPVPTMSPIHSPTPIPMLTPTALPSLLPTPIPIPLPTPTPTPAPSLLPTLLPTMHPTPAPSAHPVSPPSAEPTLPPSPLPTISPSMVYTPLPTPVPTTEPTYVPSSSPTVNCIADSTDGNLNVGIRKRLFRVTMRSSATEGGWGNYKYVLTKLATISSNKDDTDSVEISAGTLAAGVQWDVNFLCLEVPTDSANDDAVQCYSLNIVLDGAALSTHPASTIHWGIFDEASSIYAIDGGNFPGATSEDANVVGNAEDAARVCAKRGSDSVIGGLFAAVPSLQPTTSPPPSLVPTPLPSSHPLPQPTPQPTLLPTPQPSLVPTIMPIPEPTHMPTPLPTFEPTPIPLPVPSLQPSQLPTVAPLPQPSSEPTIVPASQPTLLPSSMPFPVPTFIPSPKPTLLPVPKPTPQPTPQPTVSCTEGRYFDYEDNGKSVCRDCPAGRYLNQTSPKDAIPANWGWKRECRQCPIGKAQPAEAQEKCNVCAEGQYSVKQSAASAGFDQCRTCQAGEYAFNETVCVDCELGRYAPTPLLRYCLECPSGYYTGVAVKATACYDCAPGYFHAGADFYINDYRAANAYELECTICPAVKSLT